MSGITEEPVVILAGGLGTRLREETEYKPKSMILIGNIPIIIHIMQLYDYYGFKKFIICLGYKGEMIKQYFLNFKYFANNSVINLKKNEYELLEDKFNYEWEISLIDTGLDSNTGKRIALIEKYIETDYFMLSYGDTVSDVDLNMLKHQHKKLNTVGILTGVHPRAKYGVISYDTNGYITEFQEKPLSKEYVNGGFYRFEKSIFDYLDKEKNQIFEVDVLPRLAHNRELSIYKHDGFWFAVDTYKDYLELNEMWNKSYTPWYKQKQKIF